MLQRLEERRHKETPRRLVGHGPSDDKNTFRGLRNPNGEWALALVSKLVQALWRLRVLDWLKSWTPMVIDWLKSWAPIDWPKSWTTRRCVGSRATSCLPAAAAGIQTTARPAVLVVGFTTATTTEETLRPLRPGKGSEAL